MQQKLPQEITKTLNTYKENIFSEQSKKQLGRFLLIYFLLAFVILSLHTIQLYSRYKTVSEHQANQAEALRYWENVISQHPNFPDAYYNAAVSAQNLNMKEKAVKYSEQAIYLDPGFKDAEELRRMLSN